MPVPDQLDDRDEGRDKGSESHQACSVMGWIGDLTAGRGVDSAAQALWERYYDRLVTLAQKRLRARPSPVTEAEDAAASAFGSFCRGAAAGRYPRLGGRDDLWGLLVTITVRKVADQIERDSAQKRDWRRLRNETDLIGGAGAGPGGGPEGEGELARIVGREPTPEFAAMVAEECKILLDRLQDPVLRQVALLRMEGYQNDEIVQQLGSSLRSVERKLARIRKTWQSPTAETA
jgi:DNA-directed RNA polymerase specialized sigma24 family protein